ncbi:MAG: hypothetical protein ABI423_03530, partial [Burkholderiales bacterium]
MSTKNEFAVLRTLIAAVALCASTITAVEAAPVKVEAVIATISESKLEFADGSKRYMLASQRQGKAAGT